MADQPSSWTNSLVQLGGFGALTAILGWLTNHRLSSAQVRKTDAETEDLKARHSADLERTLNERTKINLDSLGGQVSDLMELVKTQNIQLSAQAMQLAAQSEQINNMEREIADLRKAYDEATKELHAARVLIPYVPPVCRVCDDFKDDACTRVGGDCRHTIAA